MGPPTGFYAEIVPRSEGSFHDAAAHRARSTVPRLGKALHSADEVFNHPREILMRIAVLLASMLTSSAIADIQFDSASFGPGTVPFNGTVLLDMFDDHGGLHVLESIEFTLGVSMSAHLVATFLAGPQAIEVGISGSANASDGLLLNLGGGILQSASSPVLDQGAIWDFGSIKGLLLDGDLIDNPIFFPLYTGAGEQFEIDVTGTGIFGIVGGGNALLEISDFQAGGTLGVTYTYSVIPAPASFMIVGLAGLVGRVRRR